MGQHFTLGAGPAQIIGQHVLPRLYSCRRLCPSVSHSLTFAFMRSKWYRPRWGHSHWHSVRRTLRGLLSIW